MFTINDKLLNCFGIITKSEIDLFLDCIGDLLESEVVQKMCNFTQHGDTTTFDHCLMVSFKSFQFCRKFNLDYRAAARGGLLHDLFLYDWHDKKNRLPHHAYKHPLYALKNAKNDFDISKTEANIIASHMFPLCFILPRCKEALIVSFADKISTLKERKLYKKKSKLSK